MITLTGFADEISQDLEEQLDVLESENIRYLELRGVWGKNVLNLTDEEVFKIKERLDDRGFGVSSIGSPIGKIQVTEDFVGHFQDAKRAVNLAKLFGAPYVRIFSFYIPQGEHEQHRAEVMDRLRQLTQLAERTGVKLLHENESHIYGDTGERCHDLLSSIASPHLRAAFDPANFVQCGLRPIEQAYSLINGYVSYVHVKDAIRGTGSVVPAGEGDGQLSELIQELKRVGYSGFMSLEPHLRAAGRFDGFSHPQLFVTASQAIKKLLAEQKLEWN